MLPRWLRAPMLASVLLLQGAAFADEESDTAAQLFRSASAAFERKEYRAAAIGFEEAHRRRPHGATMYNAALAWESAGEPARAADAFALSLAEPGLSAAQAAEGRGKLEALEKRLGLLLVTGPAGATVSLAHVQRAELPRAVHLPPGQIEVSIEFSDGTRATKTARVSAGAREPLNLEAPVAAPPPPSTRAAPPAPRPPPPDTHGDTGAVMRGLAWTGIGAGAVAFGVGIFLGVKALDARDEWEASGRTKLELYDRADSLRTWTNVVWIGAGALAAAGVVLLVAAPSRRAAALRVGPGGVAF